MYMYLSNICWTSLGSYHWGQPYSVTCSRDEFYWSFNIFEVPFRWRTSFFNFFLANHPAHPYPSVFRPLTLFAPSTESRNYLKVSWGLVSCITATIRRKFKTVSSSFLPMNFKKQQQKNAFQDGLQLSISWTKNDIRAPQCLTQLHSPRPFSR